jgi:hypothetical protein
MTDRFMHLVWGLALCVAGTAQADSILYESATNGGGLSNGGTVLDDVVFLGSEFTLNSAATITNIIGEVHHHAAIDPGQFFMTLLKLSGPGLPNNLTGNPFGGTTQLFTTTFSAAPDFSPDEVSFPLSLSVSAGTYAVVFGSGLFGSPATALGFMPQMNPGGNIVQPGANLLVWFNSSPSGEFSGASWFKDTNNGERFVVEGTTTIPEPSLAILIGIGFVTLAFRRVTQRDGKSRV